MTQTISPSDVPAPESPRPARPETGAEAVRAIAKVDSSPAAG